MTPDQALRLTHTSKAPRRLTIKALLEGLMARIQDRARNGHYDCYYEVPNVMPGLPLYDNRVMRNTVIAHLRDKGWDAIAVGDIALQVSWKTKRTKKKAAVSHTQSEGTTALSRTTRDRVARLLGRPSSVVCKEKK